MSQETYRGYIIEIRTIELPSETGWRSLVNLEKHTGSDVFVSPVISLPTIFKTEGKAKQAGLQYGADMVDQRLG
jgi:hypothetical protein